MSSQLCRIRPLCGPSFYSTLCNWSDRSRLWGWLFLIRFYIFIRILCIWKLISILKVADSAFIAGAWQTSGLRKPTWLPLKLKVDIGSLYVTKPEVRALDVKSTMRHRCTVNGFACLFWECSTSVNGGSLKRMLESDAWCGWFLSLTSRPSRDTSSVPNLLWRHRRASQTAAASCTFPFLAAGHLTSSSTAVPIPFRLEDIYVYII